MRRSISTFFVAWFLAAAVNATFDCLVLRGMIKAPYLRGPARTEVDGGRFV